MMRINKIGILTSGGDAPGMNAAVRAAVRNALFNNLEVIGIYRGYEGLIDRDFHQLNRNSVSNIIHLGGTILKTARSERFMTDEGIETAYQNLVDEKIDAIILIGGDGTFRGANLLGSRYDFPVVGLPGTIDNDLNGTDFTIGHDTAVNTVIQAVDKIRDTATSHNRLFFVEVMGRDSGFIALRSGLASGAEYILVPETKTYIDYMVRMLKNDWKKNKTSGIIIVAEGDDAGGAYGVANQIKEKFPEFETRVTILGHIQRGGSPTANDRILSTLLGYEAVNALIAGEKNIMIGIIDKKIVYTPLNLAVKQHPELDHHLLEIARIVSL
jgi:6-phosphofructokinase 1